MHKLTPSQFAITSWTTHAKNPAELAQRAEALGLTKVQLALRPIYLDPGIWADVQSLLLGRGLSIISGMIATEGENYSSLETIRVTGGFVPDEHWEENWKMVQAVAPIAGAMGLKLVSTHAGFLPSEPADPQFPKLLDRFVRIATCFAAHGLTLLFETGQETADTLDRFLSALEDKGVRNVGVNFDPANMIRYDKGDPITALRKLMPRVHQVHIKDAKRTTQPGAFGPEVPIGEGLVDWKAFMEVLAKADYGGNLVVEREAGQDHVGDVRKAIERLSKLM